MHRTAIFGVAILLACGGSPGAEVKKAESKTSADASATAVAKAGDAKTSDAKASDAKASDAKASDAKASDAKVDAKVEDAKAGDAKAAEAGDAKPADAAAIKAAAAARPRAAAPSTTKDAAKQLADWLNDPEKAQVPALLDAAGELELATYCGPCTDNPPPDVAKTTGPDLVVTRLTPPPEDGEGMTEWAIDDVKSCKDDCCTFTKFDPDSEGSGSTSVDKICMTLTHGKPTAYKRIDALSH